MVTSSEQDLAQRIFSQYWAQKNLITNHFNRLITRFSVHTYQYDSDYLYLSE